MALSDTLCVSCRGSQLSIHSTSTINISKSLSDGSINLTNTWTRQLSETSSGNVCSNLLLF